MSMQDSPKLDLCWYQLIPKAFLVKNARKIFVYAVDRS